MADELVPKYVCPVCGGRAIEKRPSSVTHKEEIFCSRCGYMFNPPMEGFVYTLPEEKAAMEKQVQEEDICAAAVYAAMDVLKAQCGTFCEKRRIPIGATVVEVECPVADLTLLREDQTLTLEQKRKFVKESKWANDFVDKFAKDMVAWGYPGSESPAAQKELREKLLEKIASGVVG
jgi:predicted RNA-binding Zn-ribbon protein involved in translation (DUF1610 family)